MRPDDVQFMATYDCIVRGRFPPRSDGSSDYWVLIARAWIELQVQRVPRQVDVDGVFRPDQDGAIAALHFQLIICDRNIVLSRRLHDIFADISLGLRVVSIDAGFALDKVLELPIVEEWRHHFDSDIDDRDDHEHYEERLYLIHEETPLSVGAATQKFRKMACDAADSSILSFSCRAI